MAQVKLQFLHYAAYLVLTAECAIAEDPTPASLENAALLNPTINTPIILLTAS